MRAWSAKAYVRAVDAEPQLEAIEALVDLLCAIAPTDRPFCCGCIWETILKPLVSPLVGWERGYPPGQAADPDPDKRSWQPIDLSAAIAALDSRPKPATATEAWLRTEDAYNAVTHRWLTQLDHAGTGRGHGHPATGAVHSERLSK